MTKKLLPYRPATLLALASLAMIPMAQADWTLIDDFESSSPINPPTYPVASNGGSGQIDIYQDVPGAGGSMAAHFSYGVKEGNAGDVWFQLDLPEDIPVNGTGTIFYRFWQSTYNISFLTISSRTPAGDAPDDLALWDTFSAIFRQTGVDPWAMDAHSNGYKSSNPAFVPALQTWYDVWMVIDNSFDQSGNSTGGYSIYVQGPNDAAPVLMTFGDAQSSMLTFRDKTEDSIKTFVIANNETVVPDGIYLIDDIYMTTGVCTANPALGETCAATEMWGPYEVQTSGDNKYVLTDDFLGTIDVTKAVNDGIGWVYSYRLKKWIWLPSDLITSSGAWTYIPQ